MDTAGTTAPPFGNALRSWRQRRRLSQLDLAIDAGVSARHLSFIETGRSVPSRAMVLRLAAVLQVPPREQNQLLLAAGLAPHYRERTLEDPETHLLTDPNALRVALHPDGLAPRIRNLAQWRHHVIERVRREVSTSSSEPLGALLTEIEGYPGGEESSADLGGVAVPLRVATLAGQELSFLSIVTTFGTALDLTAAELSIEAFLPADAATAAALSRES